MNLTETQGIAGRLIIKQYNRAGILENQITVKNDITKAGRQLVARLFNKDEANTTINRVSKIKLGKSNSPFKAEQTNLQGPEKDWETKISSIEKENAANSRIMLRLTGELKEDQCNGEIKEAGLFTDDNIMYNRVTFEPINKSDQFRFTLIWEITF